MTGEIEELFDSEFLGRLRGLFFRLRRRRQLKRKAAQATQAAGHTREFKDYRHYVPGDDFRTIDWRLFARLERLFIRIFEEIQEFHVHILIDRSGSMVEPWPEKRRTALRLAVAVAYLGLIAQHRVSILTMAADGSPNGNGGAKGGSAKDGGVRRELPPLKGQGHIHEVLRKLASLEFGGQTDLVGSLKSFRPSRDRRGIVFLVSDLFGRSVERAEEAVAQAVSWPAETHVVHVVHPQEARPELEGELRLIDVETDETRRMWLTKREIGRYTQAFGSFCENVSRACTRHEIDYLRWSTDRAFEDAFIQLLSRGSQLAGA